MIHAQILNGKGYVFVVGSDKNKRKQCDTTEPPVPEQTPPKKRPMQQTPVSSVLAGLMMAGGDRHVLTYKQIRHAARALGIDKLPNNMLEEYMAKTFDVERCKINMTIDGQKKNVFAFQKVRFAMLQVQRHKDRQHMPAPPDVIPPIQRMPRADLTVWQQGAVHKIEMSLQSTLRALAPLSTAAPTDATGGMPGYFGIELYVSLDGKHCIQYIYPWSKLHKHMVAGDIHIGDVVTDVQYLGCHFALEYSGMPPQWRAKLLDKSANDLALRLQSSFTSEVLVERSLSTPGDDQRSLDRLFFYGGSQQERDGCVRLLQQDDQHAPFCVLSMKQHHAKIVDIYASSQTQQPLVVLSYALQQQCAPTRHSVCLLCFLLKTHLSSKIAHYDGIEYICVRM